MYLSFVVPTNLLVDAHSTFPGLHLQALDDGRSTESRLSKSNAAARGPADVVVVGSSRAVGAFPATPPAFSGRRFLNLAVQNTSLPELTEILRFAVEHDEPAEIVIGADFEVFHYAHLLDEFLRSHFNPAVHASEIVFEQALSVHATGESLETLRASREGGRADPDASLSRLAKFEILLGEAVRLAIDLPPKPHVAADRLASFRAVVLDAQQRGARVRVVILPVHATILCALDRCGLWGHFEDWKRDMVAALSDTGAELWDFNGFDEPQCEPIPAEADPDQDMQWFTDASHCSPGYGNRILARVLDDATSETLGVRLTPETLDSRLETVREQRRWFEANRSEQLELVERILAEDRDRRAAQHH